MARFIKIEVALKMKKTGLVPVFYHQDIAICKKILRPVSMVGFEFLNSQIVVIMHMRYSPHSINMQRKNYRK